MIKLRPKTESRSARNAAPTNGGTTGVRDRVDRLSARVGYRTRTLALAGLLALLAFVVLTSYVRSARESAASGVRTTNVFVAARDLQPGVSGEALVERGFVVARPVPRKSVVPGAATKPAQIASLVVAERIYAGEQVSIRRFRPAGELGLRGELRGNLRGVAITGDRQQLLTGIIRAGDRVDVAVTLERRGAGGNEAVTRVILRALRVLRAPEATGDRSGGTNVVLAVTDRDAQKLLHAVRRGQWSLLLRPGARGADSATAIDTNASVLGER